MTLARLEPAFVLGTAQLGNDYGVTRLRAGAPDLEVPREFLLEARRMGVDVLDTAPAYGSAESIIGQTGWPGIVHTKVSSGSDPHESVLGSLERLRVTQIDVLYLHDPTAVLDAASLVIQSAHSLVGPQVRTLGASIYEVDEFHAALTDDRIGAVQVPCNVFDHRFAGERLVAAANAGKEIYVRSALLQGVLVAPSTELPDHLAGLRHFVDEFHSACRELDRTPLEAALGWVRSLHGVTGLIVGTASATELNELLLAFRAEPLDTDEFHHLDRLVPPPQQLVDPRTWNVNR